MKQLYSPPITQTLLAVFASAGLLACASTVVQPQFESAKLQLQRPERILVYDFAVSTKEVTENQGFFQSTVNEFRDVTPYQHEQEIADEVKKVAAEEIIEGIRALGLPAERAKRDSPVPAGSLAITGHFLNVDEGNKLRRTVIGLGAGQSRVDIQVQMYGYGLDASRPAETTPIKLADFETAADSGKMPGALVTGPAGAAAAGGMTAGVAAANVGMGAVKSYRSAMGQMTSRSAEQAVAYMSEFFGRQGWIPADKVTYGKRK